MKRRLFALLVALVLGTGALPAQPLFRSQEPLTITLTTNLRDLTRERDSTNLRWFGAELKWTDSAGTERTMPTELRARGHFRRQTANCAFPPIYLRAAREDREGTILQGNPRVKIVTPCRPASGDYQQYIFTEFLTYKAYEMIDTMHHRTRLVQITYVDSAGRGRPVSVTGFFLETPEEVADHYNLKNFESPGTTWEYLDDEIMGRISLFEFMVGNTDWSVSGLHNIIILSSPEATYRAIPYDFDWSGLVNPRYATPNPILPIRSVRQRLHRGPCRTAEQWAPTIAYFKERRPAIDSLFSTPLPGQDPRKLADAKKYLDDFWPILDDERRFRREVIETCRPNGN